VEDDPRLSAVFRDAVKDIAEVLEAADGDQALEILEQVAPHTLDLVLLDEVVPKRSGLELLHLTKGRWPSIPVVLMTGYGTEELAVRAFRGGAVDYLRKPIPVNEFRRMVVGHARADHPVPPGPGPPSREEAAATHLGVRRAIAFLKTHFTEPVTLSQVALEAGVSKFHLCRLFRSHTGMPLRHYLQELRVDRAKTFLTAGGMTVTEIAYATGFNDLSNFDKVFNQIVGVSPTEYRRRVGIA